jgi:hypothetical protein
MNKILSVVMLLTISTILYAQKDITRFLGIPVDGSKSEMIQKLKAKGYRYNSTLDCLEGEFNGRQVYLSIVTNNNKVWRIAVIDVNDTDETNIKIRFNNLCQQFKNNEKYISMERDYTLAEEENIEVQMLLHKKRYQASFYQLPIINSVTDILPDSIKRIVEIMPNDTDKAKIQKVAISMIVSKYPIAKIGNITEKESEQIATEMMESIFQKSVWFMIDKKDLGKYYISMFYDNEYNHSNGEDL